MSHVLRGLGHLRWYLAWQAGGPHPLAAAQLGGDAVGDDEAGHAARHRPGASRVRSSIARTGATSLNVDARNASSAPSRSANVVGRSCTSATVITAGG